MEFLFETYFKKGLEELDGCDFHQKIPISFRTKDYCYDCIFSTWEVIFEKIELDYKAIQTRFYKEYTTIKAIEKKGIYKAIRRIR